MKRLLISSALILGCLTPMVSYANTINLKFDSVGGASNGQYYIYPYNFSVNGSSTLVPMMCASYDNEISVGESWTATEQLITTGSSKVFQEDAYLFSLLGTDSTLDIQQAVWYLSDSSVPLTANQTTLIGDANSAVTGNGPKPFDNGSVAILIPNAGSQSSGGIPQNFLVDPTVLDTPEPSSLLLTGTGLLGSAITALRRRRFRA